MSSSPASVSGMHWLNAHQPLVETIAIGVLALVAIIVLIALVKVLRQGRRAMFGAQPIIGPTELISATDGGLVLLVPFANGAAPNAYRFVATVTADRVPLSAQTGPVALFGYGAHPADNRVQIPFDWPVGILDAEVTITWTWHDAAGDWDGAWRGHIRVPHPEMPEELHGGSGASGPFIEDAGGPSDQAHGDARADVPPIAGKSRVDPLSHIRGGTAKQAQHPEPGQ
jgi:hypothetical protein